LMLLGLRPPGSGGMEAQDFGPAPSPVLEDEM
jgi:hypothetical protein